MRTSGEGINHPLPILPLFLIAQKRIRLHALFRHVPFAEQLLRDRYEPWTARDIIGRIARLLVDQPAKLLWRLRVVSMRRQFLARAPAA